MVYFLCNIEEWQTRFSFNVLPIELFLIIVYFFIEIQKITAMLFTPNVFPKETTEYARVWFVEYWNIAIAS